MKEKMPPLQGLYYFYIAGETGSFKSAADRLFVTAAAVSQQIRLLEDWLGTELFIRQHRKVHLTHEGEMLFRQAQKGFAHLQDGIRQINQDPDPNRLSISTLPSFAQHWLVPRIRHFREKHPEIALLIEPKNELVTFQDSSVDLCIRYGTGNYKSVESIWLMDEVVYPVCHPLYQKEHQITSIEDLSKADLIEDMWPDMDWQLWQETLGIEGGKSTLQYDGSHFVLEGALSVQGVALVKHSLAYRYLQEGKLVRIGDVGLKPRFNYFLCAPSGYFRREKIQTFATWIQQQVQEFCGLGREGLTVIETDYSLKWNGKKKF
ncbi:putative DNA-binding transcriptional activator GcvA [Vibrio nigripulchritudo SO65]|uniref:DNA-binding transcriptional activator GcvA n=1 Tax=Vibrio nigripulchritudo SOn1 TaxID=1238450 RepID=A0AAV2VX18_9VIBR|nr:LysR substrate-binding domain-containing protein [Vibrio nigripulchritudo]CCN33841.1 putative DNA-binding transcriptional activator GcvA [Vibrio nigripulchritudo AM115]CCN40993.1 putative DNA-binding transcriptional activator GcvA [Vibrio nigripulchritudo FTn2]CCN67834.1 putative DNA-binding transcriptional activator GcvA [Vibrio nigripulchritudo POn4]CCN73452.1 putative DNA-binding transcriptional activator GcvA [Vibrio nigripulchritudo SFn118]CCN79411.1 putative DNA-binding transcriptiona